MNNLALLVVHGIGAQQRGETLRKLLNGLRKVADTEVPAEPVDGVCAVIGGRQVRLYEVYWADLLMGDSGIVVLAGRPPSFEGR